MNRFYDTLAILSAILAPVAMIASLGWTAYTAILEETGIMALAAIAGVATAAAVECIGIVAGETALRFHGRGDSRWLIAAVILIAYVAFGIVILRGTALSLLPVMAGAVYVLIGLRAQVVREEAAGEAQAQRDAAAQAAQAVDEKQWQREQWRIAQDNKTRLKLAEIEARASTELAQSESKLVLSQHPAPSAGIEPAQSGQSQYQCEDCGREFPTVQAINAHRRFCKKGAPLYEPVELRQNGHG